MYKLIVSKIMLSTLIFILVVALCACGKDMDVISQEPALEEEYEKLASEEETSDIKDSFMEDAPQEETEASVEDEKFIMGSIPDGSREVIKYLFDYIYPDQSDIYDIELYETEAELYYKYWFKSPYTDEIDVDPTFLCYFRATRDELYQEYVVYVEILDTYYDENENVHKEHFRNSIGNFLLINTATKEVIPQWLFNEDAEDDASYRVENDRYWEIMEMYSKEKTEDDNDIQEIYKQVMAGDLTALSQMEDFERIESAYNNLNTLGDYEWKLADIDHNGYEELVWQEKEDVGYMKRIVGLFSFEKDPKCIIWDLNDSSEFYFISDSGNLVYYDQYFGMYRFFSLDGYTLDENLDLDFTYGLRLYDIYDLSEIDENYLLEFQESNPDIVSEGTYYQKIIPQGSKGGEIKEILTEEQFVIEFAELMGTDFYEYYEKFS